MSSRLRVFGSSVGTKIAIGLTGLALLLYLVTHIAGNLLIFLGPRVFNQYSHVLLSNPLIPIIEIGLLVIFAIHVYKSVRMFLANQQARPLAYARKRSAGRPSRKSIASSTMIASGLLLLLFVVVHVTQFKYGTEYMTADTGIRDLYRLEMENFSHPLLVVFYVLSMMVVGSHLWHGVSSAFQSVGADEPRWTPRALVFGRIVAVLIAGGFMVIALWAYFVGGSGA